MKNLCAFGEPSAVAGSGPWSWSCKGVSGGKDSSCVAKKIGLQNPFTSPTTSSAPAQSTVLTNGVCGPANSGSYYAAPTTELCASGKASPPIGFGPWFWTCEGLAGGFSKSCSAALSTVPNPNPAPVPSPIPISPICGSSSGATFSSVPTSNLCDVGTASPVAGTGPWNWTCQSKTGSTTISCTTSPVYTPKTYPKIFWASYPIKPNESALVRGNGFELGSSTVLVSELPNTDPGTPTSVGDPVLSDIVTPLQSNDNQTTFVVPQKYALGVYAFAIKNPSSNSTSSVAFLNKPDPWFYLADGGNTLSPGGWIQVYGRSMFPASSRNPSIALVSSGGTPYVFSSDMTSTNNYSTRFQIPTNFPEGVYTLYVHNGFGGPYGWTKYEWHGDTTVKTLTVKKETPWPNTTYTVSLMSGGSDDEKVAAALAFAKANGGGVIQFGASTYHLTKPLLVPQHTLLRGITKEQTILSWTGSVVDNRPNPMSACAGENGSTALVTSDYLLWTDAGPLCSSFSVENLTIRHETSDDYTCIKRTSTGDERAWFKNMACSSPNKPENTLTGKGVGIYLRGTINTEITGSTFDYRHGIDFHGDRSPVRFVKAENNTFRWRVAPYSVSYANNAITINNNRLIMAGTESGNGTLGLADVGDGYGTFGNNIRDIYVGSNVSSREDGGPIPNDAVDLTFDGTNGAYFGKVSSVSGVRMTLAGMTAGKDVYSRVPVSVGGIVQILAGKGAGQSRILMSSSASTNTVMIDEPWSVEPDSTSWINISDYQGRYLFVGNTFTNHSRIQFYFPTSDIILANNNLGVTGRKSSVLLWTAPRWNGFSSGMFFQMLDNTISKGGVGEANVTNALETPPSAYPGFANISQVFRNNSSDGAPFTIEPSYSLDGLLIEKNTGLSSIVFKSPAKSVGVTVRGNRTSAGATTPVSIDDKAVILP